MPDRTVVTAQSPTFSKPEKAGTTDAPAVRTTAWIASVTVGSALAIVVCSRAVGRPCQEYQIALTPSSNAHTTVTAMSTRRLRGSGTGSGGGGRYGR